VTEEVQGRQSKKHKPHRSSSQGVSETGLATLVNRIKRLLKPPPVPVGILVSYPKSGRTWLRMMLQEVGVEFHFTHDGFGGSKAKPFDETRVGRRKRYRIQPVVFLYRDPRDTVVSDYFWRARRKESYSGTITDFIRDPLCGIERIVRFNLAWLERGRTLPSFLSITYEDLSANPVAGVRHILGFAGVSSSDAKILKAVENNTFERMKDREAKGAYAEYRGKFFTPKVAEPEAYKVRRGKRGGYLDSLSPEDITYCDDVLERHKYFENVGRLSPHQ
jgi:hypothetical protein